MKVPQPTAPHQRVESFSRVTKLNPLRMGAPQLTAASPLRAVPLEGNHGMGPGHPPFLCSMQGAQLYLSA